MPSHLVPGESAWPSLHYLSKVSRPYQPEWVSDPAASGTVILLGFCLLGTLPQAHSTPASSKLCCWDQTPKPSGLLPLRLRPHKPEWVSDPRASEWNCIPSHGLSPGHFPKFMSSQPIPVMLPLGSATDPRVFSLLRHRPRQPGQVSEPSVLWPNTSCPSTSTTPQHCSWTLPPSSGGILCSNRALTS